MSKTIYDPEKHYPKGTPFTYLIGWTELDVYYYGVRFRKNCHPSDLWKTYFTSSKIVEKFRLENGEPDLIRIDYVFDTKEEAREYEDNFFRENNCVRDSKWLNLCRGGEDFCNLGHSEKTKQRISDSKKGKKRKPRTPEHCKNIGDANKGKPKSDEQKQKQSDTMKGKKQKPRSAEHCKNISDAKKGKPKSDEQKQKQSDTMKNKPPRTAEHNRNLNDSKKRNRLAKLQTLENCF